MPEPTPLRRLFGFARPYRGRLVIAVLGMLMYAAGSAGLAALIQPIFDSVLPNQEELVLVAWLETRRERSSGRSAEPVR